MHNFYMKAFSVSVIGSLGMENLAQKNGPKATFQVGPVCVVFFSREKLGFGSRETIPKILPRQYLKNKL